MERSTKGQRAIKNWRSNAEIGQEIKEFVDWNEKNARVRRKLREIKEKNDL